MSAAAAAAPQLLVFDEAQQAIDLSARGEAKEAASAWQRVVDICEMSVGPEAPMTLAAVWQYVPQAHSCSAASSCVAYPNVTLVRLSNAYHDSADFVNGRVTMQRIVAASRQLAGPSPRARTPQVADFLEALRRASSFYLAFNSPSEARALAAEVIEVATAVDDAASAAFGHCTAATCSLFECTCGQASFDDDLLESTLRSVDAPGVPSVARARVLRNLAVYHFLRDRVETAREQRSLPPIGRYGSRQQTERLATALVHVDEALSLLPGADTAPGIKDAGGATEDGGLIDRAETLVVRGLIALCSNDLKAASSSVREAMTIREHVFGTESLAFAHTLALLGTVHHAAEQAVTAEGLFRAALEKLGPSFSHMKPAEQRVYRLATLHYADLLRDWDDREREGEQLLREVAGKPVRPEVDGEVFVGSETSTEASERQSTASSSMEMCALPSVLPFVGSYRFPCDVSN